MKNLKLLFFAMIALSLVSCNDDDNTPPGNNEKVLLKTIDSVYAGGELAHYWVTTFENNKKLQVLEYQENGTPISKIDYVYSGDGHLISALGYSYTTDINDFFLSVEVTYDYDTQDRLVSIISTISNMEGIYHVRNESFVHNDNNTITKTNVENDESPTGFSTYFLDNQGRVFKHEGDDGTVFDEVTYNGNNVVNIAYSASSFSNYMYDDTQEVKGQFLNSFINQFGNYTPNAVLVYDFPGLTNGIDRFMINESGMWEGTWEYEFDEDGYPVGRMLYPSWSNTVPVQVTQIIYE